MTHKDATVELYQQIYKNTKMGSSTTADMIGRLQEGPLKTELAQELAGYEKLAHSASIALTSMGVTPKEEGIIARASARAGVMMNTMIDSTPSHIAGMVIEGCAMGTTDMIKLINEAKREGSPAADSQVMSLAQETVDFEEDCAKKMKAYL